MRLAQLSNDLEEISQGYTSAFNIQRTPDWFVLKLQEEVGELTQSYLMMGRQARTKKLTEEQLQENFKQELADVFCHTLLLAKQYDINLEEQVAQKWLVHKKPRHSQANV